MSQFTVAGSGMVIRLGLELGRGGEGTVFGVEGQGDCVAKIYTKALEQQKIQKLTAMIGIGKPELLRISAWPTGLLKDANGAIRGFLMPRINARRDIHELYSPKSRAQVFPVADFRFLVHVGVNIARVFAVIHENGHVIGDINHGNLAVGPDGTVRLIDCDSFQIGTSSHTYTCDVGVPLFTAPELHGRIFKGLVRTPNHDQFGLAILLFHLFYMGRHPFAGRYLGQGDMPVERAISEYRFAYGPSRASYQMAPPPNTIPLETMGTAVTANFIRSFDKTGSNGGRPNARQWIADLENLKASLRVCSTAKWHQYPGGLSACPWCDVESKTGVRLFGQRITPIGPIETIEIRALWQAIIACRDPGPAPALPSEYPWKPPSGIERQNLVKIVRRFISLALICSGFVSCAAFAESGGFLGTLIAWGIAAAIFPWIPQEVQAAVERKFRDAEKTWQDALKLWQRNSSNAAFTAEFKKLEREKAELEDMPNERRRRLARLYAEREKKQLQDYLDRFRIDQNKIPGIGPSRTSMLTSYGIETAADIERHAVMSIPGFGYFITDELVKWRSRHEKNFQFNPNQPIDPLAIQKMDLVMANRKNTIVESLRQGPVALKRLGDETVAARSRQMPILKEAWSSYKIAEYLRNNL